MMKSVTEALDRACLFAHEHHNFPDDQKHGSQQPLFLQRLRHYVRTLEVRNKLYVWWYNNGATVIGRYLYRNA